MPELKKNILNFGYGVNFKYEGMLSHSFDRFYIVTKFELPKTKDLKLATFEVLKYSLEQYIGFVGRLAFNHYCGLHQV